MAPVDETTTDVVVEAENDEAGGIRLCSVVIPEGKKPGDVFTYKDEDDGLELEVTVPPDGKAGDTMEILLDEDDDEIEAVMVSLGPHVGNITLNMVTLLENDSDDEDDDDQVVILGDGGENPAAPELSAAERTAKIEEDEAFIDQALQDAEDEEGDGTNFMVWPAGIELGQFLASTYATTLLQGKKNALELGSGCGVSGMALTAALSKISTEAKVTLTDLPQAMSLLTANMEENKETLEGKSGVTVETAELSWGETMEGDKKYDLIIGSDLLYNAESEIIDSLSTTMTSCLSEGGHILLGQRWRRFDEERAFFTKMESLGYEFIHIKEFIAKNGGAVITPEADKQEGSYEGLENMCNLSWQNFGNKESDESVKFFTETKFKGKDGIETKLDDIDEEDLAVMADGDFDDCELAFIQLFVGSKKK